MKSIPIFFFLCVASIATISCSDSSSDSSVAPPVLNVLSPANGKSVGFSTITIEIKADVTDVKAINTTQSSGVEKIGTKYGNSFFIKDVTLEPGENKVQLSADGGNKVMSLTINYQDANYPPVIITPNKKTGFGSLTTDSKIIHATLDVTQYYIDTDGDGEIDIDTTVAQAVLNYPSTGSYIPSVIIRTSDNILYSNTAEYSETVNIIDNPSNANTVIDGVTNLVSELQEYKQHIYALTDDSIFKIAKNDLQNIEVINLVGFSGPKGFTIDNVGNIYIADTGANRVVKLLSEQGYIQDLSFVLETAGTARGELDSPVDVTLSGEGEAIRVFVLDAGNNRIQVFNFAGAYLDHFDGSTTAQGVLNNPINMVGAPDIVISDFGNKSLRRITYDELTKSESGSELLSLNEIGKVSLSSTGLLLPDLSGEKLIFLAGDGSIKSELPIAQLNKNAIAFELNHQVLFTKDTDIQLRQFFVPKTNPENSPEEISKNFTEAYLNNDTQYLTNNVNDALITQLGTKDVKAREAFSNMISYSEKIYANGLLAVVTGVSRLTDVDVRIKFYFIWKNEKWNLNEIL